MRRLGNFGHQFCRHTAYATMLAHFGWHFGHGDGGGFAFVVVAVVLLIGWGICWANFGRGKGDQ